jgi:hypothetical protein
MKPWQTSLKPARGEKKEGKREKPSPSKTQLPSITGKGTNHSMKACMTTKSRPTVAFHYICSIKTQLVSITGKGTNHSIRPV